jgi:hypothetical protein
VRRVLRQVRQGESGTYYYASVCGSPALKVDSALKIDSIIPINRSD